MTKVRPLDPALLEVIEEMAAEGWDQDEAGRIDWEAFLSRVERTLNVDLPTDMLDADIRRIQRVARAAVREARI